jgi:hypothetical protein
MSKTDGHGIAGFLDQLQTRVLHLFDTVFVQVGRASMPVIGYALEVSEDSEVPNMARRPADGSAYPVA